MTRPIGYFVHHQGRGHAIRAAAVANALPPERPITIFCARDDIFPALPEHARVITIPSLFEARGDEAIAADWVATPSTLHCAPLGWPAIREAMAALTDWFRHADPALIISDVSAEVAQLARIASVPHVAVLQHGDRSDPGHMAAYEGAAGILAPFHEALAQPDWNEVMHAKTCFAPGLGADVNMPPRDLARWRLGLEDRPLMLVVSGGGGDGVAEAPLGVGARAFPGWQWVTIGNVRRDWHATPPANLSHKGWVENAQDWIAAADCVIASTGNTTCQQILAAARPWIAIPEWRYFDEQAQKAAALGRAGVATQLSAYPASARQWRDVVERAIADHDPVRQIDLVKTDGAQVAATWLEALADRLWTSARPRSTEGSGEVSALTIARGRETHLTNMIDGLSRQSRLPDELVIGVMQPTPFDLPDTPFPVRQIHVSGDALPLAAARNAAVAGASGDALIFLDVDCIPEPGLVADYLDHLDAGGLMMGEVLYLPAGATERGLDFEVFADIGVRHADRRGPPEAGRDACRDTRCFWSLNFAMSRADWHRAGGFDEDYVGYGGEDTDFGRRLEVANVPLWWVQGARAYHQFHPHAMPPVHHLRSVLQNADVFARKWGQRTMQHWIEAFTLMGLIEEIDGDLSILREPDEADHVLCRQSEDQPFASSATVLEQLRVAGPGVKVAAE